MDCNNFYASCERVFNPALNGKPIVVLSNNDGCVIARSNEAKALGIKMGVPSYESSAILFSLTCSWVNTINAYNLIDVSGIMP